MISGEVMAELSKGVTLVARRNTHDNDIVTVLRVFLRDELGNLIVDDSCVRIVDRAVTNKSAISD
jgi:hypothetical protein